jgi:hypothetical protein
MKVTPLLTKTRHSLIALALMSAGALPALAQDATSHSAAMQAGEMTLDQKTKAEALLQIVRDSTERFQSVEAAEAAGYKLQFGCVSGDSSGAMGLHYVNGDMIKLAAMDARRGFMDATHPQIVIFEPQPNGKPRLVGADYLVFAADWDKFNKTPPELMGQLFHLFDAPNRFELPAFYTLHAWAWKRNPNGAFVNWHPNVNCEPFNGDAN